MLAAPDTFKSSTTRAVLRRPRRGARRPSPAPRSPARRSQMRRRRPRPGVTAAATTAVFATGAGPGVTALAATAVFATGWPMTPTRPTRAGLSGISVSLGGGADELVGLDGGDDRLDRD